MTGNVYSYIIDNGEQMFTIYVWKGTKMMTISGKKYRIKSGRRFAFSIYLIIMLLMMTSNLVFESSNVSGMTQKGYVEITVQTGDTLWNIARKYMPDDVDIRKSVYTLRQINGIAPQELRAGQILMVPLD